MSDQQTSKLSRGTRENETREKTARRRAWAPPSRLDAPEPPPGYKHRWIRAESAGQDDRINIASKLREGYELVRAEEYPDFYTNSTDDGRHAGVISVGGLLLARIPDETVAERNAYYSSRTQDQLQSVDNELLKSNAHTSMKINGPQRQTRVSFRDPGSDQ